MVITISPGIKNSSDAAPMPIEEMTLPKITGMIEVRPCATQTPTLAF
jgi:hypothetical protein